MTRAYRRSTDDRFLRYAGRWIAARGQEMFWELRYTTWGVFVGSFVAAFLVVLFLPGSSGKTALVWACAVSFPLTMKVMHEVDGDATLRGLLDSWRNQALSFFEREREEKPVTYRARIEVDE